MQKNQSKQTIEKQDRYTSLLRSYSIQTPYQFNVWDWYAGCGGYEVNGTWQYGSPIVAAVMLNHRPDVKIFGLEKLRKNFKSLVNRIDIDVPYNKPNVFKGDCRIPPRGFEPQSSDWGLSYFDPPGEITYNQVTRHCTHYPNVDILIRAQITTQKRCSIRFNRAHELRFLKETIWKEHWYVTRPYAQKGWSFIFGTNRNKFELPSYFIEVTKDKFPIAEHMLYRNICLGMIFNTKELLTSNLGFTKYEIAQWPHPPMEDGSYQVGTP